MATLGAIIVILAWIWMLATIRSIDLKLGEIVKELRAQRATADDRLAR